MTPIVLAIAFAIGVCLSGGHSGTTVILMPDEDGKVGAVTVKTPQDSRVIDKAYYFVTAKGRTAHLSEIQEMGEAQVNKEYADLLKAQPAKPSSFILYFVSGSSELTEESRAMLPQVIGRIKEQAATEISVIGHTDATGSDEINNKLSLERAKVVERILKDSMPSLDRVDVKSFGSKDPLVPAPPNTDEPRNRRVEILIL